MLGEGVWSTRAWVRVEIGGPSELNDMGTGERPSEG